MIQHLCNGIKLKRRCSNVEVRNQELMLTFKITEGLGFAFEPHGTGKLQRYVGSLDTKEKHDIAVGVYVLAVRPTVKE